MSHLPRPRRRAHLYHRLYLTLLSVTLLSLLVTAALARAFHPPGGLAERYLAPLARLLECDAERCGGPAAQTLGEASRELRLDIAVWDEHGRALYEATEKPLAPPAHLSRGWRRGPLGHMWVTPLGNGRTMGLRERGHLGPRGPLFLPLLVGLAVAMAVGLYPLSRSITRRLEHLALGAQRWGAGDLSHRVLVDGCDEIGALAERFNQAAAAIEGLVAQERQMLATASHELRTPLARMRMALELLAEEGDADRRAELVRKSAEDIAELDALVEELLLSARAQPGVPRRPFSDVDVLAMLKEEGAAVRADVTGDSVHLFCDRAMVKRMVRNLLVNARLHGGAQVSADVRTVGATVLIAVEDDGPGVPEAERERIFAPFYRAPGPRPAGDTGVGLGLSLVRQVARYHGGDVRFVARQPKGSRFEVTLPADGSAA
jgi:signal transduction histidine kinase